MIKDSLLEIVNLQFEKKNKNIGVYGQNLTTRALEIYNEYKNTRTFRRKSGVGDIVNGEHKGVVVNYHFSLQELKEVKI